MQRSFSSTRQEISGILLAVGATVIWSGNFVIARGLHASVPPVGLAFWRWFVATIALAPFALPALIRQKKLVKENICYLSITALIGVTIFNTLIYIAGHSTSAINLALIAVSSPVFIIILDRLLCGEPITPARAAGTIVAIFGVILLITDGSLRQLMLLKFTVGDIWMLIAAFAFGIYSILAKRKPARMSVRTFLLSTFFLGLIFLLPFYLWEHARYQAVIPDRAMILAVFYVGIGASLIAFLLWNKAILYIGPSRAGLIYYLVPVFSGITAHIFLNEAIRIIHGFSMLLIFFGILYANRKRSGYAWQ